MPTASTQPLPAPDGAAIIDALSALHPHPGAVIAFDADGTLWGGDVADDLFAAAAAGALIREAARPALVEILGRYGLDTEGSPTELAARIDAGYRGGQVGELDAYGMLVWTYAGLREVELVDLATEALRAARLRERLRPAIPEVLDFARAEGLRVLVVSASPVQVVAAGLALCGLKVDGLVGAQARVEAGQIAASLAEPLPYGPLKVVYARARVGQARWLASFGDSAFDFELLAAAELAVAVGPKPALRQRLAELPGPVLLYEP